MKVRPSIAGWTVAGWSLVLGLTMADRLFTLCLIMSMLHACLATSLLKLTSFWCWLEIIFFLLLLLFSSSASPYCPRRENGYTELWSVCVRLSASVCLFVCSGISQSRDSILASFGLELEKGRKWTKTIIVSRRISNILHTNRMR